MTTTPGRLFDEPQELFEVNPSKLQCYLDCPLQYRFRYVDHRPERRAFSHTALGRSVHKALRDFYALPAAERTVDTLLRLLRRAWDASGYRSQEEAEDAFERAEGMLRRYFECTDCASVRPLALESKFSFSHSASGILVTGRVDRLDADGGEYVVVDYKTGSFRQDVESLDASLPLSLYAIAASGQLRRAVTRIVLEHLATATRVSTTRDPERLERDWRELTALVETMRADRSFPANPGPLCRWCDYLSVCREGARHVQAVSGPVRRRS